jgi:hypothetical protein
VMVPKARELQGFKGNGVHALVSSTLLPGQYYSRATAVKLTREHFRF